MTQSNDDRTQTPAAPEAGLDAASIVADLQQRCESLRQWHVGAEARLKDERRRLDEREAEADRREQANQSRHAQLDQRAGELDERERTLDGRAEQLDGRQRDVEKAEERVQRLEGEVQEQQAELTRMREELDEEWASLHRVRRAQESLASALETEQQRVSQVRYRFAPGHASTGTDAAEDPSADADAMRQAA